jgi:hypothetical protein
VVSATATPSTLKNLLLIVYLLRRSPGTTETAETADEHGFRDRLSHLARFHGSSEQPEYTADARRCPVPLGGRANTRAPGSPGLRRPPVATAPP